MVLLKSFKRDEVLPPGVLNDKQPVEIVRIAEDNDVFLLQPNIGVFKINLKSMHGKKVSTMSDVHSFHSFSSVYDNFHSTMMVQQNYSFLYTIDSCL